MKEGLDCDSRVLRMRYSSQDWVSHTKALESVYRNSHSQASACTSAVPEVLVHQAYCICWVSELKNLQCSVIYLLSKDTLLCSS